MAATPEQRVQLQKRRLLLAPLVLRRQPPAAIQRALAAQGMEWSLKTIVRDVEALKAAWRKELIDDPVAKRREELIELEAMEQEAASHVGDIDWWDRRLKAKERKAKMLGLDAPVRQELTGQDGGPIELAAVTLATKLQRIVEAQRELPTGSDNGAKPD